MPIQTQRDYEQVVDFIRSESAKPKGQRDDARIEKAMLLAQQRQEANAQGNVDAPAAAARPADAPPNTDTLGGMYLHEAEDMVRNVGTGIAQRGREIRDFVTGDYNSGRDARGIQSAQEDIANEQRGLTRVTNQGHSSVAAQTEAGHIAADTLATAPVGGITARTIGGAGARVLGSAVTGGVLAGSASEDSPKGAAALGALGAGAIGFLLEIPGMARNFLLRDFRQAVNSDAYKAGDEASKVAGVRMSLGQKSESPPVLQAEASTPGRPGETKDVFFDQQQKELKASFDKLTADLDPAKTPMRTIITRTKQAYESTVRGMSGARQRAFRDDLTPALQATGAKMDLADGRITGGKGFLHPDEAIGELYKQRADIMADKLKTPSQKAAEIRTLMGVVDNFTDSYATGGLKVGEAQETLATLSSELAPTGKVLTDLEKAKDVLDSKRLAAALQRDLDRTATSPGREKWRRDAANSLIDARTKYGAASDEIRQFEGTAINGLLGKAADPATAESFVNSILRMPDEQVSELMTMVDKSSPGMANKIRSMVFSQLVSRNRMNSSRATVGDLNDAVIQGGNMVKELAGKGSDAFRALITGPGVSQEMTNRMHAGLITLQKIAKSSTGGGDIRGIRQQMEQVAINAASRDSGFIARLLAGELTPGVMEKLLYSANGPKALMAFATPTAFRAAGAQSINYIVEAMKDDDSRRAEFQAKAMQQQLDSQKPDAMAGGTF